MNTISKSFVALIVAQLLFAASVYAQPAKAKAVVNQPRVLEEDLKKATLPADATIDSLCLIKSKRQLWAFKNGRVVKIYHVALGSNPVGAKQFRGDGKTPEGHYFITDRSNKSRFYMSIGISYPSMQDVKYASSKGKSTGGDIRIHGWPNGYTEKDAKYLLPDWTLGCIAVTNKEIEELYRSVVKGCPIMLLP